METKETVHALGASTIFKCQSVKFPVVVFSFSLTFSSKLITFSFWSEIMNVFIVAYWSNWNLNPEKDLGPTLKIKNLTKLIDLEVFKY